MKFEYHNELEAISQMGATCPPASAEATKILAWRWVSPSMSINCFHPQAMRNPRRLHKANDISEKCSCWGLSMFNDRQKGVTAFCRLEKTFKKARKIFGGNIASGVIEPVDGVCTQADHNGHFDFHPSDSVDLVLKFTDDGVM